MGDTCVTSSASELSAADWRPFPREGVTLCAIDEFIELSGGQAALRGLTTTEVCNKFMIPQTKATHSSYCMFVLNKMLQEERSTCEVSDANCFVSHAWKYEFLSVVDTLRHISASSSIPVVFWFDLFSNNQHDTSSVPYEWWECTFKNAIEVIGNVVIVFYPWYDPIPLKRAWCLFEIYCAVVTGSKFDIAMTPDQKQFFIDSLIEDYDVVMKLIAVVDVGKSDSFLVEDKEKILHVVTKSVGVQNLNRLVISKLWTWVIECLESAISSETSELKRYKLQDRLGLLYRQQGLLDEAESMMLICFEAKKVNFGPIHESTMETMNNLAELYGIMSKYEEAESLMRECYEARRELLTVEHPDTLMSMHELAWISMRNDKLNIAETLFEECFELRKRILGPENLNTLLTMTQQAELFHLQGKFEQSIAQFELAVAGLKNTVGREHHKAIMASELLALTCFDVSPENVTLVDKAIEILKYNLAIYRSKHLHDVQNLFNTLYKLAEFYYDRKQFSECLDLYKEYFENEKMKASFPSFEMLMTRRYGICLIETGKNVDEGKLLVETALSFYSKSGHAAHAVVAENLRLYLANHGLSL